MAERKIKAAAQRTSGFRFCSRCLKSYPPPYGRGWLTARDGTWRCPTCAGASLLVRVALAKRRAVELQQDFVQLRDEFGGEE